MSGRGLRFHPEDGSLVAISKRPFLLATAPVKRRLHVAEELLASMGFREMALH